MRKKSSKVISTLSSLPDYFIRANSSFQKFKSYQLKAPLISYFAGLYTVQILIDLITKEDSVTGTRLVHDKKDITAHLVTVLEQDRAKLKSDDELKTILDSSIRSRDYLLSFTDEIFETTSVSIETGQATGKTVTDLLTCATLYEISRGLFPFEEIKREEDEREEEDEGVEDNVTEVKDEHNEETTQSNNEKKGIPQVEEGLADDISRLFESQNEDINFEDHISNCIKGLGTYEAKESKEDGIMNKIIAKDLGHIDDDELKGKIQYCNNHAKRIVTAVKKGENPQINTTSIDAKPITEDDIANTIKDALDEPSDDEDGGLKFPELPRTLPGGTAVEEDANDSVQNEDQADPNDQVIEESSDFGSDTDTAEHVAKHHQDTFKSKSIPKQVKKEDLKTFIEDGELLERATKCAKFAISAINYEDVDTAMAELKTSMDLLNQFKERSQ